jgi:uncharacterized membrane protein YkvA (DUF1232 family)
VRLLPDTLRLLKNLAVSPGVPRGARVRLWVLFAYLALPFDLIPDLIPFLGYADDAIIASWCSARSFAKRGRMLSGATGLGQRKASLLWRARAS